MKVWRRALEIVTEQAEKGGAEMRVTSCANCRLTFDDGQAHYRWDKTAPQSVGAGHGQ